MSDKNSTWRDMLLGLVILLAIPFVLMAVVRSLLLFWNWSGTW